KKYGLPAQVADVLSSDKFYSDLFDKAHNEKNAKEVSNIITTDLMGFADTREKKLELKITPKHISDLADSIMESKLTRNSGKTALQEMVKTGKSLADVMSSLELKITPKHISDLADSIMESKLTRNSGKTALQEMVKTGKSLADVMSSLDLGHVSDAGSIEKIIDEVFKEEEKAVAEAKQ